MSDSRTEAILKAVVETLAGNEKPAGLTINRSRRQPVEPKELPMISVYPLSEDLKRSTDNRRAPIADRSLLIQIRCRAVGEDSALDPLRQWVIQAMGSSISLAGKAIEVVESSTEWSAADASDADYSIADMQFNLRYLTARGDLTKAA